jgi:uncharacterized protein (UPF0248 family)
MKKLLPLFVFCISFFAISQDMRRDNISGKVIVEGNDIEGITIYNSSSNKGTVTNENGEFTVAVALYDLLEIRALEYQNFDVKINEAILESKKINIYLIQEINKLDEVRITKKGLSGNIKTDISMVRTFNPKLDAIYFGIKNRDEYELSYDSSSQFENIAMESQGQSMVNGLNVKNVVDQLLIPLFRSEVKDKEAAGIPEVPVESIKYYLGSNFLVDNFSIPEHRVEEFIRYVEEKAFDFDLLNYGHEMEFLELLSKKSRTFLQTKRDID